MINHKTLITKKSILSFVAKGIVLAFFTNRFVGLYQLYEAYMPANPSIILEKFLPTLFKYPLFFDLASVGAAFLFAVIMYLYFMTHWDVSGEQAIKDKHRGKEYGGAHWASSKEMERFENKAEPEKNILLSETGMLSLEKIPNRLYERNKHIMVLGGSGSGKSYYFLQPNIMQLFASYILTDPKSELIERMGQFLIDHGYELLVINTEDPAYSMGFNPFTMVKTDKDILRLANCIIDNTQPPEAHKDFWVQAEQLLYEFCIGYMWTFAPPEKQNIDTLIRLVGMAQVEEDNEKALSSLDILVRDTLESKYTNKDNEYFLVELYKGFKKGAGKTLKSILVSCEVRLAPFKIPAVREMMRHDEIGDMKRICETKNSKVALFVIMSAGDNTFKFLTSMVFFRLFDDLQKYANTCPGKTLPKRAWVGMDEFAQIGRIPDMERHIAFLRSYGIDIVPILQNESQMNEVYGDENTKTIKGNCDTTLFLGRCDHETNDAFSNVLGEETIIVENVSRSKGGGSDSYSISEQRVAKKLMSASDLGDDNFPGDECIIKIKQAPPFKDKKYETSAHPRAVEIPAEPFDYKAYITASRKAHAKDRLIKSYTSKGVELPKQDYYDDVVEELMLLKAS